MLDKIKKWYSGLDKTQRDNFHTVIGLLAVAILFGLAMAMGIISDKNDAPEVSSEQCVSTDDTIISDSLDGQ